MIKHPTRGQKIATLIILVAVIAMLYWQPLPAMLIMLGAGVYAAMLRIIAGLFVAGKISGLIMVPMVITSALFSSWLVPGTLKALHGDVLFSVPVTWAIATIAMIAIATIAMIAIAYAGGLQLALQWPALEMPNRSDKPTRRSGNQQRQYASKALTYAEAKKRGR